MDDLSHQKSGRNQSYRSGSTPCGSTLLAFFFLSAARLFLAANFRALTPLGGLKSDKLFLLADWHSETQLLRQVFVRHRKESVFVIVILGGITISLDVVVVLLLLLSV
jgi:hypothetical protein